MMSAERRITHRLIDYWQRIKGDRVLPMEGDIDSEDVGDMWDDCFLMSVRLGDGSLPVFSFGYIGRTLQDLYREDSFSGQPMLLPLPVDKLSSFFNEMILTKLPIVENVENFSHEGKILKYRLCLLPLGTKDGEIKAIFGGLRYKFF